MKILSEVLQLSIQFLTERKTDRPRWSAETLLAAALKCKRIDLYMQYDRPLVEEELSCFRGFLKRCSGGEPLEYILGEIEFYGCNLVLSSDVLIPRQETEILVDLAVREIKKNTAQGLVLWDLCTGSGCIGLGIKKACPSLGVILSDQCPKALAIARNNAVKNQLEVDFVEGDLLEPFFSKKADFVICNPPYLSRQEYEQIDRSVRDFEPIQALAAGEKGTEIYERLARELAGFLNPGAKVFFEIGAGQAEAIQKIFSAPPWRSQRVLKDWAGLNRFFFLEVE